MKDEFIEYGSDIHPVESEFFKELMLLCAKYGVKLKPNVFTAASKEESRAECNGEETADYPAIEFEFRESSFINDNFDIDASCYNRSENLDDDSLRKCKKVNLKGVADYHDGKCEWLIPWFVSSSRGNN